MGSPKALLTDAHGVTFLARVTSTLAEAGLGRLTVVTGPHHDVITAALAEIRLAVRMSVARNPEPERGQLSSIWTGMDEVCDADAEAVLVTLIDVPLVRVDTVRAVLDGWRTSRAAVVRPEFGGRRGHPVVFDRSIFDELRAAPLSEGARAVVRAHRPRVLDLPVDDPGCLIDIDTPADYDHRIRQSHGP
jgi:molybdenum cofactor cytidylyltransferase